jgi:hypothetical protein
MQFLTKAQGMPKPIANVLTMMTRNFIWDDKRSPPISLERLQRPCSEGGIHLLDLHARNVAINTTWLSSYLELSNSRPTWAFLTDAIINRLQPKGIRSTPDLNTFLTTWSPPRQGSRANKLPKNVLSLLKTAQTHNVTFAPLKLSKHLKKQLPAWLHIGAPPNAYHGTKDACLKKTHKVSIVKNLVKLARRIRDLNLQHRPQCDFECQPCTKDRHKGCKNPHKCTTTARLLLENLAPTYNTSQKCPEDSLTLTHHRTEKNSRAIVKKGDEIVFDPTITTRSSLSECFHIFPSTIHPPQEPAHRLKVPPPYRNLPRPPRVAYTDGSCLHNGKQNTQCGSGVLKQPTLTRVLEVK